MAYQLALCIPTFNFAEFIGATLDAILAQAEERVQVVVVDGGSTDATPDIVTAAARRFPHLKLIRRDKNVGVDRDILESVDQADAPYCWLFSSDDVPVPGAVDRVLDAIGGGDWDVLLTGMAICDAHMVRLRTHPILCQPGPRTFDWSDPADRAAYFAAAQTTTAFFSFISNIVVRRAAWLASPTHERYLGSCWIIAAKLFAAAASLKVRFDPAEYLFKRGDNDSFAARGLVWRTALALRGFRDVAADFFGPHSSEYRHISRVLKNEYTLPILLSYKGRIYRQHTPGDMSVFAELVRRHYSDGELRDLVARCLYSATPAWLCSLLLHAVHSLRS